MAKPTLAHGLVQLGVPADKVCATAERHPPVEAPWRTPIQHVAYIDDNPGCYHPPGSSRRTRIS
jgi:hypothetical protein